MTPFLTRLRHSRLFYLISFLLLTRVAILTLPWILVILLFPEKRALSLLHFVESSWTAWDARIYLHIAQNGYTNVGDPGNFIVFFPLYPIIVKLGLLLIGNPVWTGVILSSLIFIAAGLVFYRLLQSDFSEKIARWSLIMLSIFPTAYFWGAPYTESLFFLTVVLCFYFARKEDWLLAGTYAGLATFTRPFGVLLVPSLIIEWIYAKKRKVLHLLFLVMPSVISALLYLYINQLVHGNPFAFQKILGDHWQKQLALPSTGILSSWQRALFGELNNYTLMVGWAEAVSLTVAWALIPVAFVKLRRSWAVYYFLSILLFSSTTFILSTPRYLLSIPPFFVLLGIAAQSNFFRLAWGFISVVLLSYLTLLFARGQWAF
ncbi:glycosyltransferase family 39 protein [Candidatus Microgenomates bacterium]|nr:glycosyltransferase family 39 protein [Candidatus Microgenomates bacterium]